MAKRALVMHVPTRLEVLKNDQGGHADLLFQLEGLTAPLLFDTYYFSLANKTGRDVRFWIGECVERWRKEAELMKNDEELLLPIDLSDQHSGWLYLRSDESFIKLNFGTSLKLAGWSIDPQAAIASSCDAIGFRAEFDVPLHVERSIIIECLKARAKELMWDPIAQ